MSAPLSFEQVVESLAPAFPNDELVLVGGQAVNYWLTYYRERDAALASIVGVASEDVDFLGTFDAASRLAFAVHGEVRQEKQGPGAASNGRPRPGQENVCDVACVAYGRSLSVDWESDFSWNDGYASTAPVGVHPAGASATGALDMAGNVSEWISDFFDPGEWGEARVVRGGIGESVETRQGKRHGERNATTAAALHRECPLSGKMRRDPCCPERCSAKRRWRVGRGV